MMNREEISVFFLLRLYYLYKYLESRKKTEKK